MEPISSEITLPWILFADFKLMPLFSQNDIEPFNGFHICTYTSYIYIYVCIYIYIVHIIYIPIFYIFFSIFYLFIYCTYMHIYIYTYIHTCCTNPQKNVKSQLSHVLPQTEVETFGSVGGYGYVGHGGFMEPWGYGDVISKKLLEHVGTMLGFTCFSAWGMGGSWDFTMGWWWIFLLQKMMEIFAAHCVLKSPAFLFFLLGKYDGM